MNLSVPFRLDTPPDLWTRARRRLGQIERCHLAAAALDPALECGLAIVETAEDSSETPVVADPSDTSCPASLRSCIASALAPDADASKPQAAAGVPIPPLSLKLFLAPGTYRDPRELNDPDGCRHREGGPAVR